MRFLPAVVLLSTVGAVACDSRSSTVVNPTGPSANAPTGSPSGTGPGIGNTAGMGRQVANEFDYLAQMIPHHDEAITTATRLQRGTERQEMRRFASAIIATQSAEVGQMKRWLAAWYPGRDTRVDYRPMMRDLTGLTGSALDRAFLEDMIPHHMMAVMMSQQLAVRGLATHAEVVPFARNVRDTQQREIQLMTGWLRDWFGVQGGMGHGRQ
jgi:uncharacterized protein (DUF305 family)